MRQLLWQLGMPIAREAAVVLRDLRAGPPAAGVTEQREVLARRQPDRAVGHGELPELDEVIAAAARPELRPRAILEAGRDVAHAPIRIHDTVLAWRPERGADAESRLTLDRFGQLALIVGQRGERQIQHGHLHAARDVHADRVRNDGVVRRQHAADREPVADVRVGHERAGDRDRQLARVRHLLDRRRLQVFTPDAIGRVDLARLERVGRRGLIEQQSREVAIGLVVFESSRRLGDALQIVQHGRRALLRRLRLLQQLLRRLRALAGRNTDAGQVPGLHGYILSRVALLGRDPGLGTRDWGLEEVGGRM